MNVLRSDHAAAPGIPERLTAPMVGTVSASVHVHNALHFDLVDSFGCPKRQGYGSVASRACVWRGDFFKLSGCVGGYVGGSSPVYHNEACRWIAILDARSRYCIEVSVKYFTTRDTQHRRYFARNFANAIRDTRFRSLMICLLFPSLCRHG